MSRIVFLILLAGLHLCSAETIEIDEYKVDLYYANGIMMVEDKDHAELVWNKRVKRLLKKHPTIQAHIGKAAVAYNLSDGMIADLWESFLQKIQLDTTYKAGWMAFKRLIAKVPYTRAVRLMLKATEIAGKINETITLYKQINQYKRSIDSGHGVVVVAHSQGKRGQVTMTILNMDQRFSCG